MAALIYSIKGEKSACGRLHLRNEVCAAGSIICYRGFQTAILVATVPRSFNQLLDNGALSRQRSNGLCESEPLNALVGSCDSTNIPPAVARKKAGILGSGLVDYEMVAGGRFELTTFGLCDLTQLSLRVGLYLHPL